MLPATPPALPIPASHETTALALCREVATQMTLVELETRMDPVRAALLLKRAQRVRKDLNERTEASALPLVEAALGVLEAFALPGDRGERRYGRAAKAMALRHRQSIQRLGPRHPGLIPELEGLALLARMGGMRDAPWRDEVLRLRAALAKGPDAALEQALADAVEDHYGPFLTVAEQEPMLECCGLLAQAWIRYPRDAELTRRVLKVGLKSDAHRVWSLAAREGSEGLREDLKTLLDRLDPGVPETEAEQKALLGLGEALLATPLKATARGLLKRLDQAPKTHIAFRRRIARILGDRPGEALLLETELKETPPPRSPPLLEAALPLLQEEAFPSLLEAGTRTLRSLARLDAPPEELPGLLESWAAFEAAADHREEAEDLLLLRFAQADPEGRDLLGRCRCLARLERWESLAMLLAGAPEDGEGRVAFWHFRAALGLGRIPEARLHLDRCLDQALNAPSSEGLPGPFPGMALALPLLMEEPDRLGLMVARWGPRLAPGQEGLLAREPWRILVLLDPEAHTRLPDSPGDALRWRMHRLPSSPEARLQALKTLVEDTERLMGAAHPLMPEVLLLQGKEGKEGKEGKDAIPALQRALELLDQEEEPRPLLQMEATATLAEVECLHGHGPGMERALMRLLSLLEQHPALEQKDARKLPALLLLHLWREQRIQELIDLAPRVLALDPDREAIQPGQPPPPGPSFSLAALERIARMQDQIRAAGL